MYYFITYNVALKKIEKLQDELKQSKEREAKALKESIESKEREEMALEESKENIRDALITHLFNKKEKLFQSFHNMSVYVKDFIPKAAFVDLIKKYKRRQNRNSDVISTASKSSVTYLVITI